jgi:hypothetical protein
MPSSFDANEYKVISIILSSTASSWVGAMASSLGGLQWNISDSEGVGYTDYRPFFFNDHSKSAADGRSPERLRIANAQVDIHEFIHTQGGDHDDDKGSCVSAYSLMSSCDVGDFFTYPIYNRIYLTGWLPETAVTTDPSLVQDSYNATDPTKKYLLKLGNSQYQELFNGTWYQYSVRSFDRQINECKRQDEWVFADDGISIDPLYICGQLVVDAACIVIGTSTIPNLKGEFDANRNFANCEFIDAEKTLSRELFLKFLGRLDGSIYDYSGSIDRRALVMEQTDDAARLALSN